MLLQIFNEDSFMRKLNMLFLLAAVLFVSMIANASAAFAAKDTNKELAKLVNFVDMGVNYAKEHGIKKTYAEINKVNGKLRKGDLYLFVYDNKGVCLAHGEMPKERVGKNFYNEKDKQGNFIVQEIIKAAKAGGGFVKYYWLNSETGKDEYKTAYVKPIGHEVAMGAGIFLPEKQK